MVKHPAENLDAAFRKWFEDRANIIHRIEYVNPFINEFGIPRRFGELRNSTSYTGFIIKLVKA